MTDSQQQDTPSSSESQGNVDAPGGPADAPGALTLGGQDLGTIVRRLGPVGPLALIAASLPAIGGFVLLGLASRFAPWLRDHHELGIVIYIVGFSILAGLALLPTYAQAFLGGWAFGLWGGTAAALAGILGASTIGYAIARRASGQRVVELIEEKPKWKAVYEALVTGHPGKCLLIVTLLRVPPNSPFAITNLVLAATRVPPMTYVAATLVGIAPRTAVAAYVGAGTSELDFSRPGAWMFIAGVVGMIVVIGVIGMLANRAVARMTGAQDAGEA